MLSARPLVFSRKNWTGLCCFQFHLDRADVADSGATTGSILEVFRGLILKELHHRIKNTLATVSAIASQSLRNSRGAKHAQHASKAPRLLGAGAGT
jgi:hypothetical protein